MSKEDFDLLLRTLLHRRTSKISAPRARQLLRVALESELLKHHNDTKSMLAMVFILAGHDHAARMTPSNPKELAGWIDLTAEPFLQHRVRTRRWYQLRTDVDRITAFLRERSKGSLTWTALLWHMHVEARVSHVDGRRSFLFRQWPVQDGQSLMAELPARPETFDILVRAHLQEGDLQSARNILQQRESAGFPPSAHLFTCMLDGYKRFGGHPQIYDLILTDPARLGLASYVSLNNALLELYFIDADWKKFWTAVRTRYALDAATPSTSSNKPRPDERTYELQFKALASRSFVAARNSFSEGQIWRLMRSLTPDVRVSPPLASAALSAAIKGRGALKLGLVWIAQLEQANNPFPVPLSFSGVPIGLYNIMLEGLLRLRGLESGLNFIRTSQFNPNEQSWWLLINCYASHSDVHPDQAAGLVKRLVDGKLIGPPDAGQLRSLFRSHLRFFQKQSSAPDNDNSPLAIFPPTNLSQHASDRLSEDFERPSSELLAVQMQHIADSRLDPSAIRLLWRVLQDQVVLAGIRPNTSHFLPIVFSYAYQGDAAGARSAIRRGREQYDLSLDSVLYTKLMQLLVDRGSVKEAWRTLQELRSEGVSVDSRAYMPLVRHFSDAGRPDRVERLLQQARTHTPPALVTPKENVVTTTMLFEAYCTQGRRSQRADSFLRAQQLVQRVLSSSKQPFQVDVVFMQALRRGCQAQRRLLRHALEHEWSQTHPDAMSRLQQAQQLMKENVPRALSLRTRMKLSYKRLHEMAQALTIQPSTTPT